MSEKPLTFKYGPPKSNFYLLLFFYALVFIYWFKIFDFTSFKVDMMFIVICLFFLIVIGFSIFLIPFIFNPPRFITIEEEQIHIPAPFNKTKTVNFLEIKGIVLQLNQAGKRTIRIEAHNKRSYFIMQSWFSSDEEFVTLLNALPRISHS